MKIASVSRNGGGSSSDGILTRLMLNQNIPQFCIIGKNKIVIAEPTTIKHGKGDFIDQFLIGTASVSRNDDSPSFYGPLTRLLFKADCLKGYWDLNGNLSLLLSVKS